MDSYHKKELQILGKEFQRDNNNNNNKSEAAHEEVANYAIVYFQNNINCAYLYEDSDTYTKCLICNQLLGFF